jgi:ABC-type anion transport system duplicated permease subunit
MKTKDFALIAVIVFISAIVSIFVSKTIFTSPKNRQQQVEVVQAINAEFPAPDSHYFNTQSFDPAVPITIGQNNNINPFNSPTGD